MLCEERVDYEGVNGMGKCTGKGVRIMRGGEGGGVAIRFFLFFFFLICVCVLIPSNKNRCFDVTLVSTCKQSTHHSPAYSCAHLLIHSHDHSFNGSPTNSLTQFILS